MEEYLEKKKPKVDEVEKLYADAIVLGDNITIALLNLYVKENNIRIRKEETIRELYYAERRKFSDENPNMMISYHSFEYYKQDNISRLAYLLKTV